MGFSLPNIVTALSHDRIHTATLLYTSEIPKENIHRAIETANECRQRPLSPRPDLIRIPSPDADSSDQLDSIRQITESPDHENVVGVTGGTQRVLGALVARFGTERLLSVERGPKATLRVGKKIWQEQLELEVADYQRLYDVDVHETSSEVSIIDGRLSYSRELSVDKFPLDLEATPKKRTQAFRSWSKNVREQVHEIIEEINHLEKKFGRIQFRFHLDVLIEDENTQNRIVPILGRLPKAVQMSINGNRLADPIESIAIDDSATRRFLDKGLYELVDSGKKSNCNGTLHLLVGRYNSVNVANAIHNHRPSSVCLWAVNHEGEEREIQSLCNQVFSIRGWINGSLSADMGVSRLDSPVCEPPPSEVLLINTNVNEIQDRLEDLGNRQNLDGSVIDVSSGSGYLTTSLIRGITQISADTSITYTHPWTGEITNLSTGQVTPGKTLPIIDRLWLSQRPVIRFSKSSELDAESERLLKDIGHRSLEKADYSVSQRESPLLTTHLLPLDPWGDVQIRELKNPGRIEYSRDGHCLEFKVQVKNRLAGYWMDDFMGYSTGLDFRTLDCITSVDIMTSLPPSGEGPRPGIEIDTIFIEEDGMRVVSCKQGKRAWTIEAFREVLSWERMMGPNSRSFIIHSNMFHPLIDGGFDWRKEGSTTVDYLHWLELLGIDYQTMDPKEEE